MERMEKAEHGENRIDEATMRQFIDALDGMAVLDRDGSYLYVSRGWEQYTGFTAEQAIGHKVWDLMPDTHARWVYQTGKPLCGEVVHKNGVPAFTTYYPRLGPDGAVEGIFLYIMFRGMDYANSLARRINELASKVEFYKGELTRERGARYSLDNIVGNSPAVLKMKDDIVKASHSNSTVLIEGETGCGKELIAHSIHALSVRGTGNFVRVNCSAIPADLLESEFFGYAPGAFTGASRKGKVGRFQLADGGSIFLDEINLLAPTMQPKFLRVLQEREIDPVGGDRSIPVDVRVIAASNVPLESLVEAGKFRSDLYYRLNIVSIQAPPLRERMEDIPLLTETFIQQFNKQLGMVVQGIEPQAMDLLLAYDWPGNIRELQNAIESAMNLCDGLFLHRSDFTRLEQRIRGGGRKLPHGDAGEFRLQPARQAFERNLIADALAAAGGNRSKAAELLGISRTLLYEKMGKYGLT